MRPKSYVVAGGAADIATWEGRDGYRIRSQGSVMKCAQHWRCRHSRPRTRRRSGRRGLWSSRSGLPLGVETPSHGLELQSGLQNLLVVLPKQKLPMSETWATEPPLAKQEMDDSINRATSRLQKRSFTIGEACHRTPLQAAARRAHRRRREACPDGTHVRDKPESSPKAGELGLRCSGPEPPPFCVRFLS